jgi:RNA polymerase sigma factor (sigma-70 family)
MKEGKAKLKKLSDIELVKQALNGNDSAYTELMNRYKKKVEIIVSRLVKKEFDVEDLVQEIFTKAFTSLSTFKSEFSFSTWLYKIATNHCIDHIRKRKISTYSLMKNLNLKKTRCIAKFPTGAKRLTMNF